MSDTPDIGDDLDSPEELDSSVSDLHEEVETLLARVADEPHRFGFLQLLRAVEAAHPDRPRLGRSARAADDPIRLGQVPSLVFAPAELHSLERPAEGAPRLLGYGFGLLGPNGPMPVHITEYVRDRLRNAADPTLARFLDVFHHRMLCLFYRAWADGQPVVDSDRPVSDRFAGWVGSVFGLGQPALQGRSDLPDDALLSRAGRLAPQTRPAEGLQDILADFFGVAVGIREFVGEWLQLPCASRWRLGTVNGDGGVLGRSITLGESVWSRQTRFRLVLGPIAFADFRRFLPDGESLPRLRPLVRFYAGDEFAWDVQLLLVGEDVPPLELGRQGTLGRTAWLLDEHRETDADDAIIDPASGCSEVPGNAGETDGAAAPGI